MQKKKPLQTDPLAGISVDLLGDKSINLINGSLWLWSWH